MTIIFDGLSGDLYPAGQLRLAILEKRIQSEKDAGKRSGWKQAAPVEMTQWDTELYGSFRVGDTCQIEDSEPFEITSLAYKHDVENSYRLIIGNGTDTHEFRPWGKIPVKIFQS